ncbi:MAG: thermonuclease family protein [Cyanobacteria bacterium]|nr:thermonuclease family protein [Cyanobacteriota bacterium]MDA0864945.1 thermonuclease family protein [Cyanobacteriota bacterium]
MTAPLRQAVTLEHIKDGDTLVVRTADQGERVVRLYGIDCPELAQEPFGHAARVRVRELVAPDARLELLEVDHDSHGRLVAEVWAGNRCLNTQLLREGHAVAYRYHLHGEFKERYLQAEAIAQAKKLQFWSQPDPEMPRDFRRRHPRR